jgi:hypothetical protein
MTISRVPVRLRPATVLAVGLVAATLTACATTSEAGNPASRSDAMPMAVGTPASTGAPALLLSPPKLEQLPVSERAALPIDAYEISPARQDLLADAQIKLQVQCMGGFGLTMAVKYREPDPTSDPRLRRYGVSDLQAAQQFGYHLGTSVRSGTDGSATQLPAQQLGVLKGTVAAAPDGKSVPAGGCAAVAATRLGLNVAGQNPEDAAIANAVGSVSRVDVDSFQKSLVSTEIKPILGDWAGCMARRGYHFSSPIDAVGSADLSTAKPTKAEIQQAVADVRCKQSTALVQRWSAVEAPIERMELTGVASRLTAYLSKLNAQLAAAAATLAVRIPS